jgi:hypothetical protein
MHGRPRSVDPLSLAARTTWRGRLRFAIATALALSVFVPTDAFAGIRETRTASRSYDLASVEPPTNEGEQVSDRLCAVADLGCVKFLARPRERYVRIRIHDRSGLPAYGVVEVDWDGEGPLAGYRRRFCGNTPRFSIPGGATITVAVRNAITMGQFLIFPIPGIGCASVATEGTVRATFFRWVR